MISALLGKRQSSSSSSSSPWLVDPSLGGGSHLYDRSTKGVLPLQQQQQQQHSNSGNIATAKHSNSGNYVTILAPGLHLGRDPERTW